MPIYEIAQENQCTWLLYANSRYYSAVTYDLYAANGSLTQTGILSTGIVVWDLVFVNCIELLLSHAWRTAEQIVFFFFF